MTSLSALAEALEAAGAPLAGVNCVGWLVSQLPPSTLKSHRAQQMTLTAKVAEKAKAKQKAGEGGDESEDGGAEEVSYPTPLHSTFTSRITPHHTTPQHTTPHHTTPRP